ncbi:MAG: hypothetical protein ACTHMC_21145 [Pseudobacter sp.]|uniref:hypothetical protein n=1 Tax=Pseudobacter sp. TaxID=2045420 RepID=UPI003F7CEBEF
MKCKFLLAAALLATSAANAQNTNPWPSTGNVGIGTTSPGAGLHINNSTSGVDLLRLSDGTYQTNFRQHSYTTLIEASAIFKINYGNAASRSYFQMDGNNGKFWISTNYGAFVNGYEGFRIGFGEKFGFYTNGSTGPYNAIGANRIDNNNTGLTFFTRNAGTEAEVARITSTGRLGIGTIAPATLLDVNGTVTVNNSIVGDVSHAYVLLSNAAGAKLNWGTGTTQSAVVCGGPVTFQTNNLERMRVNTNGNVGIGTSGPLAKFHVIGSVRLESLTNDNTKTYVISSDADGNLFKREASTLGGSSGSSWSLTGSSISGTDKFGTTNNAALPIITNGIERMRITASGRVGIGTDNPQSELAVNGDIYAKKVKVTAAGWPDYVFADDYHLPTLAEVEAFIKKNKHLPAVPSEKEVKTNGVDLGDNQAILLKKIEELTLYAIEQQKQIEEMKKDIENMKKSKGQ